MGYARHYSDMHAAYMPSNFSELQVPVWEFGTRVQGVVFSVLFEVLVLLRLAFSV